MITNILSTNIVVVTNIVQRLSQTSSSFDWSTLNWNFLISVFAICLTAFGTLLKIYGTDIKENKPGSSPRCKEMMNKVTKLEEKVERSGDGQNISQQETSKLISIMQSEIASLKVQVNNNNKSLDEIKQDTREVVQRLDDLLQQLIEWVNG